MRQFILIYLLCLRACVGIGQEAQGSWRGSLAIQGASLPLIFHLRQDDAGNWAGDMASPAQSATRVALNKVEVRGDSLLLEQKQLGLSFKGQIGSDGKLRGQFSQRSLHVNMEFEKFVDRPRLRPQLPKPPYNYDTLKVSFVNDMDAVRLAGTLSFPKGVGKRPAVILVTGSGPQDRDETIEGHQPFKVIADYLTKQGVVVLRYDERGVGQSTGNYTNSTIGDFSKDVIAGVSFLRKQKQVDPKHVGIIGHSEGGLIAQIIAGQRAADVNFIALLAPPTIAIDSLMTLQAYAVAKSQGMAEKELQQARAINRRNFAAVKSRMSNEQAYARLLENMKVVIPNPSQSQRDEFRMMVLPSYRYFMRIDPVPFIRKINIPVFAAFGTKDVQVPFAPNLESLTDNLPKNTKNVLKAYDGVNHLFQHAKTGSVSEYADIEETFAPQVMEDLAGWIKQL